MSYTADDIARLRTAIATGALSVRNANGEMVEYRSLADMRSLLAEMEAAVAGTAAPSRQHYPGWMERP